LKCPKFSTKLAPTIAILERVLEQKPVPSGREGTDDLIEHRDGQLGELTAT
jgi:hypothetical protein